MKPTNCTEISEGALLVHQQISRKNNPEITFIQKLPVTVQSAAGAIGEKLNLFKN